MSRLHPWVLLCLAPLLLGVASTADVGRLSDPQPVPAPVPPLLEKLLELRRSLMDGSEPAFPAPPGYRLPWSAAVSHVLVQAPGEEPTHQLLHAWDFDLRYELVLAARGGRVSMVRAGQREGGCDSAFSGRANYVLIDHGDGTSALYLHIDYQGALVREGALVAQGDAIAYSGSSGLSCGGGGWAGPHLHFQVQRTLPGEWWSATTPVTFDELKEDALVTGRSYVSGNLPSDLAGRVLMSRFAHRPARGAEVYVALSRSFLAQRSRPPTATATAMTTTTPTPTTTTTGTPTATATTTPRVTATPRPRATATPVPSATATMTLTATATMTPTATATMTPTATTTPVPPATATPVPPATAMPVPPATATPVPPATATPVPPATATPVPPATATSTPMPTATSTPPATPTASLTPGG